jgi:anti-repressor protein
MNTLTVQKQNNVLVVDSRLIAIELGVNHGDWFKNVLLKYQQEIETDFEVIRFENGKPLKGSPGGRPERFAWLSEDQATVLMTYSRNTEQVRQCKRQLVLAFSEAKKVIKEIIPVQSQELERLRLENENLHLQVELAKAQQQTAKAQESAVLAQQKLMASSAALALVNPALPALVLGKPDAVIESPPIVVEKTILVTERGKTIATYQGISKSKLASRHEKTRRSRRVAQICGQGRFAKIWFFCGPLPVRAC